MDFPVFVLNMVVQIHVLDFSEDISLEIAYLFWIFITFSNIIYVKWLELNLFCSVELPLCEG